MSEIKNINFVPYQFPVSHLRDLKEKKTETGITSSDGYSGGNTAPDNFIIPGSFLPSAVNSIKEAAPVNEPAAGSLQPGRVFRITEDDITDISPMADGGFLVDEETGTEAYFGDAAKRLLQNTTDFDRETEVILTENSGLEVKVDRENLSLFEPGAVLLGAGAKASFKNLEGNILVTRTRNSPHWYQKVRPDGELKEEFDRIARLNDRLFSCVTAKDRFEKDDLSRLYNYGLVSDDPGDNKSVKWDPSIKSTDDINSRLIEAGFKGSAVDENAEIWYNTIKRKLYALESGRTPKSGFTQDNLNKMLQAGVVKENFLDKTNIYWTSYTTESDLRSKLSAVGINGQNADDIAAIWKKTTKSGYDNTGLTWDKGKVVSYILREKLNIWNERNTEWIVNSTEYCGENPPFTVGVSAVKSPKTFAEPAPFKEVRPKEVIHRHPVRDGKKQTEAYLVTGGEAALLTMRKGSPFVTFLKPGDMAVISPGVAHCVLGVNGDYEHLCFQVPSAFQYGFLFKDELNYDTFGTSEETLLKSALKGMQDKKHGTFSLSQLAS